VGWLQVTSDSLRSIAALPKLEDLAMVGCPFVNDVGLQFLENGCPLLQVSYLQCDGVKLKFSIS
jgi:F-box/leucine-rich repeat protein 2/20